MSNFSVENLVSSFKVIVYSLSLLLKPCEWWKRSGGNVKQIITRKWAYELPLELLNNLGLTIFRNEELLRLLTWIFIDLIICGFELVTCRFQLVTRGLKLVTSGFELATRGFELIARGFELATSGFELVTRGFELSLLSFNSCF